MLALTTGMRQGELLGLKWEDVDLNERVVRVRRTMWEGKASAPKTKAARRQIGLSQRAAAVLGEHQQRRLVESPWVFCSRIGTPLSCHNVHNRSWKPLLQRAGLPKTTRFHDLRHTRAMLLLGRGVHPKFVQSLHISSAPVRGLLIIPLSCRAGGGAGRHGAPPRCRIISARAWKRPRSADPRRTRGRGPDTSPTQAHTTPTLALAFSTRNAGCHRTVSGMPEGGAGREGRRGRLLQRLPGDGPDRRC